MVPDGTGSRAKTIFHGCGVGVVDSWWEVFKAV